MRGLSVAVLIAGFSFSSGAEPDSERYRFFEKHIRPVLVKECYRCHSSEAKKVRGGLRLDSREGLRRGGSSGAVVVPGEPLKSLMIQALRHQDLEMPPGKRLPDKVIQHFEQWVRAGAPYPKGGGTVARGMDFAEARKHWAFQPLRMPLLPEVKDDSWCRAPIDRFILARLEAIGMKPLSRASRRDLLRRVYYDLTGLPPTFEEVERFAMDESPDALEKVVDRLLASPKYGERWGRHWLDVARFAETKDLVLLFGKDRLRPYAYTYRDYVIRALNADTPYDQFIHEQLAADLIPGLEKWRLAAMGFLTLGKLFDNNLHDIYDDQIDTVTRGFLGLTVSCARCHDHKYDAIPTADYYSLYSVFAGSEPPIDLPLIEDPGSVPGGVELEKRLAGKRAELQKHIDTQYASILETARKRVGDYLVEIATKKKDPLEDVVFFLSLSPDDLKPQILSRWRTYLRQRASADDPVFGLWHRLMRLSDEEIARQGGSIFRQWQSKPSGTKVGQASPLLQVEWKKPFRGRGDVARYYGDAILKAYQAKGKQAKTEQENQATGQLRSLLVGPSSPIPFPKRSTYVYMSRVDRGTYHSRLRELDKIAANAAQAPARAMVLRTSAESYEPRIFIRGNPRRPGAKVPRQFLQILSPDGPKLLSAHRARSDLARAITAPGNPLMARVMVNRVWLHHFGRPLVQDPNDFGSRSNAPDHPKLLDYLACYFRESGYSLKRLHRLIVLSNAYQVATGAVDARDRENRLWGRRNRMRLDLESMRDTLLVVSGRLDDSLHGRSVDVAKDSRNRRRTVYGLVDRQDLPSLYRAFDFASPDQSAGRRPRTTVPQQALFGLSSPFMMVQARSLAAKARLSSGRRGQIRKLYQMVLAREPMEWEMALGEQFLASAKSEKLLPLERYAQVLLLTNELMFID